MGKSLLLSCGILAPFLASAQLTTSTTMTPNQLVQNVLLGNGVTATNVTFSGDAGQIGYFNGVNSNIGMAEGIVLTSGFVTDVPYSQFGTPSGLIGGPGDPDLLTIAQSVTSNPEAGSIMSMNDAAILEFDFVPIGDTVSFNFVFASEEYTAWINSAYNDAFGFFLSGPGITGPYASPAGFPGGAINLAFVPGTTDPITISTIYPFLSAGEPGLNSEYYIDNMDTLHAFNGFTTVLPIGFKVQCGQTYHFKFAIADGQDQSLDSGVFLEAESFSSPGVEVDIKPSANFNGDSTAIEGCTTSEVIFTRPPGGIDTMLTVTYEIDGSATQGTDYNMLPNPIVFPIGVDSVTIVLNPVLDALVEGMETVVFTVKTVSQCGDTIVNTGTLYIADPPVLTVDADDFQSSCADDSIRVVAVAGNGIAPFTYSWNYAGQTNDTAYVPIATMGTVTYTVTATDVCGHTGTASVDISFTDVLTIDSIQMNPTSACFNNGQVKGFISGNSGSVSYYWTGPGGSGTYTSTTENLVNLPAGEYFFTVTDDNCVAIDSVMVTALPPPVLAISETDTLIKCPNDSVPVYASASNGIAPYSYSWDFASQSGQHAYVPNLVQGSTVAYVVTVTDACGNTGTDTVTVTLNQTLAVDTVYMQPATTCTPDGVVIGLAEGATGQPHYHWTGPGNPGSFNIDASVMQNVPAGWYYFTVFDDVCAVIDSVLVTENPITAAFTPTPASGYTPLNVVFTNNSTNATSFDWDFGNGQTAVGVGMQDQASTYTNVGQYQVMLVAHKGACTDTAYATITVLPVPPVIPPTAEAPNVFTPNGDGNNDFFVLQTTNADNFDVVIVNRWGNLIYETNGPAFAWDGKTMDGQEVPEGVYFYKYTVNGDGVEVKGHGFVQVFRNKP